MVIKKYEKLLKRLEPVEPPDGLFDKIILAIKKEQEKQKTKRLLLGFFSLLIVSVISMPLSLMLLIEQIKNSGILYFISTIINDFDTFFILWREFSLAILESLPIASILIFVISIGISLFTIRLFLYKKRILLRHLLNYQNI